MNYVEHMNIFGVDYKEIPCIKGNGAPTTSTEGAVGMLYMDKLTGAMYKCTSASNNKYAWNLMIDDKTTIKEAYLGWGGKDITANVSALDAALITEMGANRLAYMPPEDIEVEYSRDGGATWVNYDDFHDDDKVKLVTQGSKNLMIGGTNSGVTTDYMSRVTINANSIYFLLRKAAIFVNTSGSGNAIAKVELFYNGDTNFRAYKEVPVAGWTGWNIIQFSHAFGSSSSNNVKKVRFTFSIGTTNPAHNNAFSISKLYMYGETQWGVASTLAGSGTIYGTDWQQNVTFPAKVIATGGFTGNLTGNADNATKAIKDSSGNQINTYYMKRGSYERIEGTASVHKNLNDYKTAGFYNIKTVYVDNCPEGIDIDAVLLVYPWNSEGYELQEITETAASSSTRRWVRKNNAGVWTEWKQIASEDDVGIIESGTLTLGNTTFTENELLFTKQIGAGVYQHRIDLGERNEITDQDKNYNYFAVGYDNKLSGRASFAAGQLNEDLGTGNAVFGQENKILENSNGNTGDINFIAGKSNTMHGDAKYNSMFGVGNRLEGKHQGATVVGQYKDYQNEFIFAVGAGTSEDDRKNAFTVNMDGSLTIGNTTLTEAELLSLISSSSVQIITWEADD